MVNFSEAFKRWATNTVNEIIKFLKSFLKLLRLLDDVSRIIKPVFQYYI